MVTRHRVAQSAADLAALPAPRRWPGGDPCAAAAAIASANGADSTLRGDGRDVPSGWVAGPHWLGQDADLAAEARAGPA